MQCGSVFSPVIEYVINLVYQLMKAIQSVVYAFSGVNIFAKATASSMESTAGSAKETSKSLAGVHDEINNTSSNDSSSGSKATSPNMDLSSLDNQMSPLAQKLYDFFKPLKDSWDNYGTGLVEQIKTTTGQVGGLISSVWGSFENIIKNGTVYSILENILAIIGNIAQAFANAWNNNGNGDAIVQNLADAFNNLLTAINNVVKSPGFQDWLNSCSDKFREISEKISEIDWQPLIDALTQIGTTVGTIVLDILSELVDIFKWLVENPIVAEVILGIAVAIGILSTAYSIWATVTGVLTEVSAALEITILPLIGIIAGIIAIITLIVLAIMNWDTIVKALSDTWEWVKQKAVEIWNAIAEFFKNLWQGICDVVKNVWNGIKDFFISIWNGISSTISNVWNGITTTISNVINGIKNTISNVLNAISTVWNNIWNGIKTVVSNIWNGIWNVIKSVINSILGGIESFVNGVIRGINFVLKAISNVANAAGSLIGLNPINLQISTISLPRLAKGGVLTEPTLAMVGEYAGAKTNPEIVTPQNILKETFENVMLNYSGSSGQSMHVTIQYIGKTIFDDTIDYINSKTRRTGKNTIVTVGD